VRGTPIRRWVVAGAVVSLVAGACSGGSRTVPTATPLTPPQTSASLPPIPSASASPTVQALVAAVPDGCAAATSGVSATVSFVLGGRAWAVAPDGSGLTCLFELPDPGPFLWGPRGDRVVVGGLKVLGVGSDAAGPSLALSPARLDWGHPKGLSLVFPSDDAKVLRKVEVGSSHVIDISPFEGRTYSDVVFHPSGLALGFVADGPDGSEIDVSSNTGTDPKHVVITNEGTVFGPIAFGGSGTSVFYAAKLADGTHMLARYELDEGEPYEKLWVGHRDVLALIPELRRGTRVALTVGTGCSDAQAIYSDLDGTDGTALLPSADGPTSVVGWLDDHRLLVAAGCGTEDLWTVDLRNGGAPTLVVRGVDRGALRVPVPTPPPALPAIGVSSPFA
jgi:hypothetical protein